MKRASVSVVSRILFSFGLAIILSGASSSMRGQRESRTLTRGQTPATRVAEAETIETRLTKLFEFCRSGDAGGAAAYFVYRGADKSREWKDTFRAQVAAEKAEVRELCRRIRGYLEESGGYRFGAIKVERESEGQWHVLEVSFRRGAQTKEVRFAFLPIKGQFAIGDIDG